MQLKLCYVDAPFLVPSLYMEEAEKPFELTTHLPTSEGLISLGHKGRDLGWNRSHMLTDVKL